MAASSSEAGFEGAARDFPLPWEFRPEGGAWAPIAVPGPWQRSHPGFHGRGEYRAFFTRPDAAPLVLEFEAVATEARVFVNGREAGGHLGAWTPFRVDLTPHLFEDRGRRNEVLVRVDEKPDHVTAGFLPFIGAGFGGIWGRVRRVVPGAHPGPLSGVPPPVPPGTPQDTPGPPQDTPGPPQEPTGPPQDPPGPPPVPPPDAPCTALNGHEPGTPSGSRDLGIRVEGGRILHEGRPLLLRGMLHWGYYPELGAPMPSRAVIDEEIAAFKSLGFNMIKFCLFFPPERYLEACDAAGMWVWMEYPVWNRPLGDPAVLGEFEEFLRIDSRHPSVVIRTFTCENDRVDEDLARRLYVMAKSYAPGGLVLDNSSWISLEKVGDFYDEHPYLHNGEWRFYGERMRRALAGRGAKPFLLGETMGVDTWTGSDEGAEAEGAVSAGEAASAGGAADPAGGAGERSETATRAGEAFSVAKMRERSLRIANRIRKHQVEVLMRTLPGTGYVMNVVRDIPSAPLGFFTASGRAKFSAKDWAWHGDTMILCDLEERSFFGGGTAVAGIFAAHFGRNPVKGRVVCRFDGRMQSFPAALEPGETRKVGEVRIAIPEVKEPRGLRLEAVLDAFPEAGEASGAGGEGGAGMSGGGGDAGKDGGEGGDGDAGKDGGEGGEGGAGKGGGGGGAKGSVPDGPPESGRGTASGRAGSTGEKPVPWGKGAPGGETAPGGEIEPGGETAPRGEVPTHEPIASNSWTIWAVPAVDAAALPVIESLDEEALRGFERGESRILTAGPRRGSWKSPTYTWWSPAVRFTREGILPEDLVEDLIAGDLLSGRVLAPAAGLVPLLEVFDTHMEPGKVVRRPLLGVVFFEGGGGGFATPRAGHDPVLWGEADPAAPHAGGGGRAEGGSQSPHAGGGGRAEGGSQSPHAGGEGQAEGGSQRPRAGRQDGLSGRNASKEGILLVTSLRHDTPAGLYLLERLARFIGAAAAPGAAARPGPPPGFPPHPSPPLLRSDSIVLEEWEMSLDGSSFRAVKCDTPLANGGKTIYEGWAAFRAGFEVPERWRGLEVLLCCEAVGDAFIVTIDGKEAGRAGKPDATWDGTRDRPAVFPVRLVPGPHVMEIRARDWRGGGGMAGPVYLTRTPDAAVY